MNTAWIVLATIAGYFALLLLISWVTGRRADNAAFFTGNRRSSWFLVTVAMIGASISGVTFISVPGAVLAGGYSYMQMVLGFFVGSVLVALVLIPMFYRMNLVSIYGYLEERFGLAAYRTGAWFFFVSKMLGASVRFFVVCVVLQALVFDPLQVPFTVNVVLTVALIWLYSFRGGVKSLIWTDSLKTLCLVLSVGCCIVFIARSLGLEASELPAAVAGHPTSRMFFFDNPDDGRYFWKQFVAGIFMVIATTGLDQDLMQRTLSCRNFRESQKNMILSAFIQIFVIGLFLVLGTLLYLYADARIPQAEQVTGDALFGLVAWSADFPLFVGIVFIIGLIAAAYSAAGSALTALTTSFTLDILRAHEKQADRDLALTRKLVHAVMSLLMVIVIVIFYELNNDSAINAVYSLAAYTYGPILGMFIFGLACRKRVRDRWVPLVAVLSPLVCYVLQSHSEAWFGGYQISFELLLINALVTVCGLCLLIRKDKKTG
ncbi:sodium:solute symporter [Mediterranea sp. An20]|uniref:sodium:solute symporter n=1 Tax=Mediterranea sp. An20 TaxID=1965586 RepID=UPI000B384181|nr:sodium:solute symporter [Mediterranea sp. An20]OUP12139.1 sodium:solute symporter [Mediterranea sp. An20]